MSLKAKIEAVIYASEEPVTLQQLVSLLGQEAQAELDAAAALQGQLALLDAEPVLLLGEVEAGDEDALNAETLGLPDFAAVEPAQEIPDRNLNTEISTSAPGTPEDAERSQDVSEASVSLEAVSVPPAGFSATPPETVSKVEPGDLGAAETRARERRLREYMRSVLETLTDEYTKGDRGLEIREVAGGFRLATKPEYHDAVRGFVRSLKPPLKLTLQALETLAVVAYKQPVTAPEVSEIRGVDSGGVLGSLMTRKLVTTAGRKQVIGRPILYKTTKEFLLRFGLKDLGELPSIEEFERLALSLNETMQEEMPMNSTNGPNEPVEDVARAGEAMSGQRGQHEAQADGIPEAQTDAERLTPAPDDPGEFTGDNTVPPVDNVEVDGRISGVPPSYDRPGDEMMDSPAHDAEVQSAEASDAEQMGTAREDN